MLRTLRNRASARIYLAKLSCAVFWASEGSEPEPGHKEDISYGRNWLRGPWGQMLAERGGIAASLGQELALEGLGSTYAS